MKQIAQFNSGANLSCRGGLRMNDAILIVLDARRRIKRSRASDHSTIFQCHYEKQEEKNKKNAQMS
jgi:hypothetical protein